MWVTYIRDQKLGSPGNGPPQISAATFAPTSGIDMATE